MMRRNGMVLFSRTLWVLLVVFVTCSAADDPLESAKQLRRQSTSDAEITRSRVDALAEETRTRLDEYREALRRLDDRRKDNDHLETQIQAQKERLLAIDRQIENARRIQRSVVPLLRRMVEVLAEVVRLDLPFLAGERRLRVRNLETLIDDPNIPFQEQYRRVMEAYQVEANYGRTIEAYRADVVIDGAKRSVEFLRIGRLALLYRTFDGKEAGYWDRENRAWSVLPDSLHGALANGFDVARKRTPPRLIELPVPAPESPQ